MNDEKNRRSYFRIPIIIGVECTSAHPPITARIANMSRGGIFVACTRPLPPGTPVSFTFHFPESDFEHPVVGEGVTVWEEDDVGMGIAFTRIDEADADRIIEFLKTHETNTVGDLL